MEGFRFDDLTRGWAASRRALLAGTLAGAAGWLGPRAATAGKRSPALKNPPANAFGCLNVENRCRNRGQCCSGICQGKRGRKRCRAHDTGGCRAGQGGNPAGSGAPCTTSSGETGECRITTGNARYCAGAGDCFVCAKDADCQSVCGSHAACVLADDCSVGTACKGPDGVACPL